MAGNVGMSWAGMSIGAGSRGEPFGGRPGQLSRIRVVSPRRLTDRS